MKPNYYPSDRSIILSIPLTATLAAAYTLGSYKLFPWHSKLDVCISWGVGLLLILVLAAVSISATYISARLDRDGFLHPDMLVRLRSHRDAARSQSDGCLDWHCCSGGVPVSDVQPVRSTDHGNRLQ